MSVSDLSCDGGADDSYVCPTCQTESHSVSGTTLVHLLDPYVAREITTTKTYGVCRQQSCSILYFSSDHSQTWETSEARPTIGFKQPDDKSPHPVCYCFGYTRENIAEEIEETGESTVVEWVTGRVQAEECACEYKNPSGRCCLGDLRETVEKITK